uniref:Uncharacterized protein n=1 Tax=Trichuris muris TaxID=70415 RepID=A0A5S6QT01_TRIMR
MALNLFKPEHGHVFLTHEWVRDLVFPFHELKEQAFWTLRATTLWIAEFRYTLVVAGCVPTFAAPFPLRTALEKHGR